VAAWPEPDVKGSEIVTDSKRELLVFGDKTMRIGIPENADITFGPFSPPMGENKYGRSAEDKRGTLRVYTKKGNGKYLLAVFSGVKGFRDLSQIDYSEEVAREEGAVIWNSDRNGYQREEKVKRSSEWVSSGDDGLLLTGSEDDESEEKVEF
jgi:hypothetical protein